jgi:CubicO group peptidase (beta-lactamase class C family)
MLKYARFQLDGLDKNGKVLMSRQALDYAHAPAVDAPTGGKTGVTWFVDEISGVRNVHRMGSFTGYRTWLEVIPEREFAVVVLTNSDRGVEVYAPLAEAAIKLFTGLETHRISPIDSDPKVLDSYLGTFVGVYQDYVIKRDGGTYSAETKSKPIYPGAPAWADPPPAKIANAGNGWFTITEGPKKGLVGELLNDQDGKPNYLRIDHRIFIRKID